MFQQVDMFPELRQFIEFQSKVLDYSADGLMVVDRFGKIIFVHNSFL